MFSVVIPVFKNYKDLERAVNSCKSDLIKEIIIVDDTPQEFRENYNFIVVNCNLIKLENMVNRGVTFSRNKGYFKSTQPFTIFLDSDDTLIGKNLIQAKNYIITNDLDVAFFNTITNDKTNSEQKVSIEGGWQLLFKMANTGERLVVVKSTNFKPFYGYLRGHELAGIFRLTKENNYRLGWSPIVLREYFNTNNESLSELRLTKERSALIAAGHYRIVFRLSIFKHPKLFFSYLLKALLYDINSRFLA